MSGEILTPQVNFPPSRQEFNRLVHIVGSLTQGLDVLRRVIEQMPAAQAALGDAPPPPLKPGERFGLNVSDFPDKNPLQIVK